MLKTNNSSLVSLTANRIAGLLLLLPVSAGATTFSTMSSSIFTSNSSEACTQCHHSSLVGAVARHAAPDGADFDSYTEASSRAVTIDSYVSTGYMPMDPGAADYTDAADLSAGEMAIVADWLNDGTPHSAATATTLTITSQQKTSVTLRGTVDTNTTNATAQSGKDGEWYFEWGPGSTATYSNGQVGNTTRNSISGTTGTHSLSTLSCGTDYHYRAVAKNGHNTATGSKQNFSTLACTDPVVAGVTIVTNATSQSATEDANADFALTVTDDDPGSLQWSKTNGSNGTVSLISPTTTAFSGSATVRYLSNSNYFGSDSFTVTVNNMNTGTSRTITFNMTVNDDNADSPVIAGTTTINDNEDGVAAANGTPTAIAVSLSATDVDNSPTFHWDVTATNDGTPSISVNTGATPTISYLPLADDNGSPADTFTVRVCDGGSVGAGNCDTQIVTVNLTAQQDTPTAVGESGVTILEAETNKLITVIGNDIDPDAGEAASLIPVNVMVTSGDITFNSVVGQQINISHGGAEETTASLTYQVQDTTGRTSANTVTANITVTGTDDDPTSADLTVAGTVDEGTTSTIDLVAISNDPEGATMAVCNTMTAPTSGNASVSIIAAGPDTGKVLYTHDGTDVAGGGEVDTFTYQVNDANDSTCASGNNSGFSTVTINLAHVNDAPAVVADSISVAEGGVATVLVGGNASVLLNDTDEENGTGTGFTVSSNTTPAFNAGFTLNSDGTFSYQHDGSENFSTSFDYTVNDGALDSASPGTVSITVTPVNDQPSITSTAPTAALVLTEQSAANVYQLTQTDVDDVAFTYSLGATGLAGATPAGNMAISASGLVTWTPPRTGLFNHATAMVTVTVSDVDSSTAGANILSDVQNFMVSTSPVDADSDNVADYSDNCPGLSNASQADFDNDTVHILPQTDPSGIPVDGDVDPSDPLTGGDACDTDDDNDGISDVDEQAFPGCLDQFNAADATEDCDGDGIDNITEVNDGDPNTSPDSDNVGPTVTAPADITVDATGLLTVVDLGTPTAVDGNDGNASIFKAAVNLTTTQLAALDDPVTGCQVFSDYETDIEPFRPGAHIVTWATCDSSGNSGRDEQTVNVKPLVSVTTGQFVGEGQTATVEVVLNGDAIGTPATVDYTVTGTASATDDHDASAGTVTIDPNTNTGTITFDTTADAITESSETVQFTLHTPVNVALSNARTHTVTITEDNVAPHVALTVTQAAVTMGNTVYQPDGNVTVTANANDANGDVLSFDWSASNAALLAASTVTDGVLDIDPTLLTADAFYDAIVTVSDGSESVTINRLLHLKVAEAVILLVGVDTDGDGLDDDDPLEGFGDSDADGIPNYLDDNNTPANAIQVQTADLETTSYIETNPGLHLAQGETAIASEASGVLVGLDDVSDHGGAGGTAVLNAATDYTFVGSLLNFEVSGLTDDITSVDIVIPLTSAIQEGVVYRKYNSSGWFTFVEDDANTLKSSAGEDGSCPQPGSNLYANGLLAGNLCIQMTIEDGGANDADGIRNYVVKDPGGLALEPVVEVEDDSAAQANGRVGALSLWLLVLMPLSLLLLMRKRQQAGSI